MKTEPSLREVLAQLANEGLTNPFEDETLLIPNETTETRGSALPWFVKLFIGISAWTAAILITATFFIVDVIDEDRALVFGLVFCILAIVLNRIGRENIFWGQLSLAMSLTGQILAIVGLLSLFDFFGSEQQRLFVVVFIVLLESILIWLHRDPVLRFISTLVVTILMINYLIESGKLNTLPVFIFILAVGTLSIYLMELRLNILGFQEIFLSVGSGLAVSLLGILILPLLGDFSLDLRITAVLLFSLLLFLLIKIVLDLGYSFRNRAVLVLIMGCALLLIPSLRMPGILAAIIVLVLGFWRNNRGLMGLASIFLVFYIWAYYYSLEWTLLAKSLVLLTSGVILLALRYFVVRFITKAGGEV